MTDDVPLREYIEAIIAENNRRRDDLREEDHRRINDAVAAVREHFNAAVRKLEDARDLQAGEYERRLEALNHTHAEARRVLNTYVPMTSYVKDQEAFRDLKSRVDIDLADRAGRSKGVLALFTILSGLAFATSVVVAILTYVASFDGAPPMPPGPR